ncbi:aminotransferase class V-fold PLP-dependent enzyme [Frisingicoccus sp.]|uniref:aminotransferase class V-fold PLP-dependent enzyme n=1 Tax=Frisingicoccus sp. TaxID=1918627 RepID=UPI0015BA43F5
MIYFDNAATTLQKPEGVEEAVIRALRSAGNAGRGAHEPTLAASRLLYHTREKLAKLFGVSDPSRIAFTGNATEALNMAIQGIFRPGDHVITSVCEHNSVLRPLYLMGERGVALSFIDVDDKGRLRYDLMEELVRKETKALVLTHASNLTGNVTDLERAAAFAKKHGLLLVVDGAQSAGILPVSAEAMGIDVFCFTGHKGLMGPQGTGGIYVREGLEIAPLKVGGSGIHSFDQKHPALMPTALEAGTLNVHGIAGLGASVDDILQTGTDTILKKEMALARRFICGIQDLPEIHIYGDLEAEIRTGIVSLNIGAEDSAQISDILWEDYEICVRAGAHCAPLMHKALGTVEQGAVRFSFSYYNTIEEIDIAIQALRELT